MGFMNEICVCVCDCVFMLQDRTSPASCSHLCERGASRVEECVSVCASVSEEKLPR